MISITIFSVAEGQTPLLLFGLCTTTIRFNHERFLLLFFFKGGRGGNAERWCIMMMVLVLEMTSV